MSDEIKKLLSIMNESTTSGSVAPVAGGIGKSMLKRPADSIFAAESVPSDADTGLESAPKVDSPANFGLWKNSSVIGKEQYGKHGRKKTKVDKTTIYPQLAEAFEPEQEVIDNNRRSRLGSERNAGLNEPDEMPDFGGSKSGDFGTWHFKFDSGNIVKKDGKPLLASSIENAKGIVKRASQNGVTIRIVSGAPEDLSETYEEPKDMDDWSEEDWAEWDAKVGRVGAKAKAQEKDREGVAEGSDGWIGNPAKWKEAVLQAHGPDVVFKNYSHPGQPGKRSVNAINAAGKQVGVYQRHNKMGMVQPNMQGVAEGFGDKIKGAVKAVKRASQGWDKNAIGPGGEKLGDPRDIVKRAKSASDDSVQRLAKHKELGFPFGGDSSAGPHSPRGLQKKALDREMKKRGLGEQGVTEAAYNPDTFVGKKGTYKGYGITQEGPRQWGISSSARKFPTLQAAKRHVDKNLVLEQGEWDGTGDQDLAAATAANGQEAGFADIEDKTSISEGAQLKRVKREYNQAAKDAGGDRPGAGKKIDNMKKSLRQRDVGKDRSVKEDQEITEEMIADRLKSELDIFKKGTRSVDKSIGKKPADREVQKKPTESKSSMAKKSKKQ